MAEEEDIIKVLVYEPNQQILAQIINCLIEGGYEVSGTRELKEIVPMLKKSDYRVFLCDCNSASHEAASILGALKRDPAIETKAVLHTENRSREFVVSLLEEGVYSVIFKPFVSEAFMKAFLQSMNKLNIKGSERRRHIRVEPESGEDAKVTFRLGRTSRVVNGSIINLSMGGFLIKVDVANEALPVKEVVKRINVRIKQHKLLIDAIVVGRKDTMAAFQFVNLEQNDKLTLSRYIYDAINPS